MPRHPRIEFPGALYHVFTRGNNKQIIFRDKQDRQNYLNGLRDACERQGLTVYAFCLMDNHVHHLFETSEVPLRRVMQSLLTRHARSFNIRHKRIGHVFQGRYRAILCDKDTYLLELVRYIHLNPVRAGLVKSPDQWRWSSHRAYVGREKIPWLSTQPVLRMFNKDRTESRRLYKRFVFEAIGRKPESQLEPMRDAGVLGPGEFQARSRRMLSKPKRRLTEHRMGRRRLEDLLQEVAKRNGVKVAGLKGVAQDLNLCGARREALVKAVESGWSQASVSRALRRGSAWASLTLRRWRISQDSN